jgi:transcriptional regulator with XRE-family HTH domain
MSSLPATGPQQVGFGKALRFYRRRRGLTQQELGERLGFDQTTISDWERGRDAPRDLYVFLDDLAEVLAVDPQTLQRGEIEAPVQATGTGPLEEWKERKIRDFAPNVPPEIARQALTILDRLDPSEWEAAIAMLWGLGDRKARKGLKSKIAELREQYQTDTDEKDAL